MMMSYEWGRTLQWATAVAVFFLPKVWTLCDMIADVRLGVLEWW